MMDEEKSWDLAAPDYQRVFRLGLNDYNASLGPTPARRSRWRTTCCAPILQRMKIGTRLRARPCALQRGTLVLMEK